MPDVFFVITIKVLRLTRILIPDEATCTALPLNSESC